MGGDGERDGESGGGRDGARGGRGEVEKLKI